MHYSKQSISLYKWLRGYKSKRGCSTPRCDETDYRCLEFHHLNRRKKSFTIADGVKRGFTKKAIMAEIKKCRIVCANCHRKITIKEFKD